MNVWSSAALRAFTPEMITAMAYLGFDGHISDGKALIQLIKEMDEKKSRYEFMLANPFHTYTEESGIEHYMEKDVAVYNARLIPVSSTYKLKNAYGPSMAEVEVLNKLSDIYDTDWAITCGLDRSDPMKVDRLFARTIFTCIAKGLPGSRSMPYRTTEESVPNYIYFLLYLEHITNNTLEGIKELILNCHTEYDGVDTLCGERWGIWDLEAWAPEYDIKFEAVYPTYDKQRGAFNELYLIVARGLFKAPPVPIYGSKSEDVLREEMAIFQHDSDKKWFGSPEKEEKKGIQDDAMFATAWCIYGGRELSVIDFRPRGRKKWFGTFINPSGSIQNRLTKFI